MNNQDIYVDLANLNIYVDIARTRAKITTDLTTPMVRFE